MDEIRIRCDRCGFETMTPRYELDPPNAVSFHTSFCIKCERSGEFETSYHLDAEGKEIIPHA
jgi:hypothetical protein